MTPMWDNALRCRDKMPAFQYNRMEGPMAQAKPCDGEQSYFKRKEKHRAKMTFAKFIL